MGQWDYALGGVALKCLRWLEIRAGAVRVDDRAPPGAIRATGAWSTGESGRRWCCRGAGFGGGKRGRGWTRGEGQVGGVSWIGVGGMRAANLMEARWPFWKFLHEAQAIVACCIHGTDANRYYCKSDAADDTRCAGTTGE